jgi:hypothetical protein
MSLIYSVLKCILNVFNLINNIKMNNNKRLELKSPLDLELDKAFNLSKELYYKENPNGSYGSFDRLIFDNLQDFVNLKNSIIKDNIYNRDAWVKSFESICQTETINPASDQIIYGIFELSNNIYYRVRVDNEFITFMIQIYNRKSITYIPINQPNEIKKIFDIYQDLFWNLVNILNNKPISDILNYIN